MHSSYLVPDSLVYLYLAVRITSCFLFLFCKMGEGVTFSPALFWGSNCRMGVKVLPERRGWYSHSIQRWARPSGHWFIRECFCLKEWNFLSGQDLVGIGCRRGWGGSREERSSSTRFLTGHPFPALQQRGRPGTGALSPWDYAMSSFADRRANTADLSILPPENVSFGGIGPWLLDIW